MLSGAMEDVNHLLTADKQLYQIFFKNLKMPIFKRQTSLIRASKWTLLAIAIY